MLQRLARSVNVTSKGGCQRFPLQEATLLHGKMPQAYVLSAAVQVRYFH